MDLPAVRVRQSAWQSRRGLREPDTHQPSAVEKVFAKLSREVMLTQHACAFPTASMFVVCGFRALVGLSRGSIDACLEIGIQTVTTGLKN
jgi:hypothetical protein